MDMQHPVMLLQHDAYFFPTYLTGSLGSFFTCGTSDSKCGQHFLEVYFKIIFCLIYRMWAILSNPQVVLHLSHNLPAEWNCSCISKCFCSIIHIKELSVVVKMPKKKGNETIFSSQEATQLIFMDSDSEGDEVD